MTTEPPEKPMITTDRRYVALRCSPRKAVLKLTQYDITMMANFKSTSHMLKSLER